MKYKQVIDVKQFGLMNSIIDKMNNECNPF